MASIFSPLTKNIGIDLGTSTTQVYVEGRGIVLSEPSVMATDERNSKIIAVGRSAEDLLSRSPETVKLHRPLVHGVIADYSVTRTMLGYILSKCVRSVQRLRIMIGVPSAASNVEKRAVMEAVYQAGAKEAFLIETAAAAALGVNLPVYDPVGNMVIDIGGGTSEIACISLGGIVCSESINTAGDVFTNDIQSYVRQQHNIRIGERTAEAIKCSIGAAVSDLEEEPEDFVVTGPNMLTALPQTVSLSYSEIAYALEKSLTKIDAALMKVLESMPPELYADIVKNGIYLAGGGALIKGLDRRLGEKTGIPFHVAEDPLRAIARGTGIALKNINRFSFLMK